MKVFIDNDIAVKMAQWGVLGRFTQHLIKQGGGQVYGLKTLQYKFKLKDARAAQAMLGSAEAVKQLTSFVASVQTATAHDQAVSTALSGVPNIDAGEVALFAAAAHFDAVLVDTGDKKALRALAGLGSSHSAITALAGKLACLEQTLEYLVGRWSWETVRNFVTAVPAADAFSCKCFGQPTETQAVAALQKEVAQLRASCGAPLATAPFAWIS
jgi:hypothetical protein